ncbi:MAG: aldehyde dehydrogenase family protein [Betaproteobacteria bacterium]|nr:MAG: aldehyde dehydrogenase family protein [Betaproteobacteria bacterium]
MNAPAEAPIAARALIGDEWRSSEKTREIRDPYRGDVVGVMPLSTTGDLNDALNAAVEARDAAAALPGYERAALLKKIAQLTERDVKSLARLMARETGKAIKDAEGEIRRSLETFALAGEEAIRIEGRHIPLDGSAMGAGKMAFLMRFPVGVVAAITPFNAPFNLAAHKIAPAIAAGDTLVLKPPPQAPIIVHKLVELVNEAGVPKGMINTVYGDADIGAALVADPRVEFITFTGSSRAGEAIKAASGLRRVALELGGNGATIVCDDADLEAAAAVCARNSMRLAGQSCISVQSVYVMRSVYDRFVSLVEKEVRKLKLGDPLDPESDVGTLIDEQAANRVEDWVKQAVAEGAKAITGGKRHGAAFEPTVMTDVKQTMKVVCEEVFGPVINIIPVDTLDQAIDAINASPYGLQSGIFTKSNEVTFKAIRRMRVGGLIINGTSTWRTDQLAYGGVKSSGIGREGPRYAIEEMTEQRLIVFNL